MKLWVIGSPRSGTSFITDYLGLYTEGVFNEPWETHPHFEPEKWEFDCDNFVLKYCRNWMIADDIVKLFSESMFIHVIRSPSHVLYSWVFPKENSWPVRNFEWWGDDTEVRFDSCVKAWQECILGSFEVKEKHPYTEVIYENIRPELLGKIIGLDLKKEDLSYRPRNLQDIDCEKMDILESMWRSTQYKEQLEIRRDVECKTSLYSKLL